MGHGKLAPERLVMSGSWLKVAAHGIPIIPNRLKGGGGPQGENVGSQANAKSDEVGYPLGDSPHTQKGIWGAEEKGDGRAP